MKSFFTRLTANILGSAGTLILLLICARHSSPEVFGEFAWLLAVGAIIPAAFDTASLQLITKQTKWSKEIKVETETWLRSVFAERIRILIGLCLTQSLVAFAIGLSIVHSLAMFFATAAGASASLIMNEYAQSSSKNNFLVLQIASFAGSAVCSLTLFFEIFETSVWSLLATYGFSRMFVLLIAWRIFEKPTRAPGLTSLTSRDRASALLLFLIQFLSVLATYLDSVLSAAFGFGKSSDYQLTQKPLLAVGVVNVSIGQDATIRVIRGERTKLKTILMIALVGSSIGSAIGFLVFQTLPFFLSRLLEIEPAVAIILGAAFGLSAATSKLGPQVLVDSKTVLLFVSSLGQVAAMLSFFFMFSQALGLVALALGVFAAKTIALLVQMQALRTVP